MARKEKEPAFEERLRRLQEIVSLLEQGGSSLEESVKLYKSGLEDARLCREELAKARHEVEILNGGTWETFDIPSGEDNDGQQDKG